MQTVSINSTSEEVRSCTAERNADPWLRRRVSINSTSEEVRSLGDSAAINVPPVVSINSTSEEVRSLMTAMSKGHEIESFH